MGCVQAKPPESSESRGLGKLKQENGYVGRGGFVGHRRSTGQRDMHGGSGKEYIRAESKKQHPSYGKLIGRERDRESGGNGGSMSQRISWLKPIEEIEVVDGWPKWLTDNIPRQVLTGLVPRSADSYVMLTKVGQGTYSNVYKARDRDTNKIVALKKVRFDTSEPESVKFMAREIMILQQLDHPNIIKLEGLATSRLQYSLHLVFDFMQTDLATIISRPEGKLTEAQVKCYMHQLLSGLQHCHDNGILHRDIKGANLLIAKNGMLKIADFGLANYYTRNRRLTNRVVTLWYRAPELLLGATDYGVGIGLWGAGCLLAEMFVGSPIMPARTEVEQIHRIFKLCGTPSDEYWKKLKLSSKFKIPPFRPSLTETFSEFPASSLGLLNTFLALDPAYRGCASLALQNEFFYTSPLACDLSDLPVIYSEDNELKDANEERKYRNSRMKHRSRTVRERRRKDLVTEKPKEDKEYPPKGLQEQEKTAEPDVQFQEPDSTASSASSGVKPASRTESPIMLPKTHEAHPNSSKNTRNLPPLPISAVKDNNMFRFKPVHRSASTRDFRKTGLRNHFDHVYAIDD
ncbi:hypothetical protein I3842_16G008600 [Carya illinoinensis]|uniref:Protein kinase domain-containing protein n=1 Tax=Carya illinoinensis TaxID=32201 RepID=A0A922D3Y0_CARIL|nr:hypothetical protein I3842_16G008600 [Carya illinoinensis]